MCHAPFCPWAFALTGPSAWGSLKLSLCSSSLFHAQLKCYLLLEAALTMLVRAVGTPPHPTSTHYFISL